MPSTLWDTYQQVGIKEDIDDVISNISPTKTPFQSMIGRDTADNTLFQWQEDSLRAAAANSNAEGFTATAVQPVATQLRDNRTQILSETVSITGTSDAVAHYGRAKESAYQLSKSMAQVKRDLEFILINAQAKAAGSSGVARTMASFQAQLNNTGGTTLHVTNGSSNMVVYTGAAGTAPAETTDLMNLLQQLYTNGVDPSVILVTPTNAVTVAGFVASAGTNRTRFLDNGGGRDARTLVNVVEVYVSPFGEQKIVLDRFLKSGNTLVFDPDMWKLVSLRPWFRETLAKTGDSTQYMIVGEYSLKHRNFAASGAIVQTAGFTGF